jgi:hypothetical protein
MFKQGTVEGHKEHLVLVRKVTEYIALVAATAVTGKTGKFVIDVDNRFVDDGVTAITNYEGGPTAYFP